MNRGGEEEAGARHPSDMLRSLNLNLGSAALRRDRVPFSVRLLGLLMEG